MNLVSYVSHQGPWLSLVILTLSTLLAAALLRFTSGAVSDRYARLAAPVCVFGAALALLAVLVPYLIIAPATDDTVLTATMRSRTWLYPAALVAATWTCALAASARCYCTQQRPHA